MCAFVNDRLDAEAHQAFLTREALANIAETTLESVRAFERGEPLAHEVRAEQVLRPVSPEARGAGTRSEP